MGKWTDAGFVAQKMSFYTKAVQNVFQEAYGPDFLLDPATPQGIIITRLAELFYNADMDGIEGFSRLNLNVMSGIYLDIVGKLRGMPRGLGTPQTGTIQITCSPNNFMPFIIPQGHIFSTLDTGDNFIAIAGTAINSTTATLQVAYSESGNSNATVGALMRTDGFGQITNIELMGLANGQERETDIEYRTRLLRDYPAANNTIEYIETQLRALQIVKTVGHEYNDTAETVDTIPAYCTEFMVVPVATACLDTFKTEVATTIVNNKVPGSPTAGNTTVDVVDVFGSSKTIKFTIPDAVQLQINVQVSTPESTGYISLDGVSEIRTAIAAYINGLGIGDDVSYSRCMAPLTADPNFDVANFQIRVLPVAPEWQEGTSYNTGDIVNYLGTFYISTQDDNQSNPTISGWNVYNEGWVNNQNFSIDRRQYATINVDNIYIGV